MAGPKLFLLNAKAGHHHGQQQAARATPHARNGQQAIKLGVKAVTAPPLANRPTRRGNSVHLNARRDKKLSSSPSNASRRKNEKPKKMKPGAASRKSGASPKKPKQNAKPRTKQSARLKMKNANEQSPHARQLKKPVSSRKLWQQPAPHPLMKAQNQGEDEKTGNQKDHAAAPILPP